MLDDEKALTVRTTSISEPLAQALHHRVRDGAPASAEGRVIACGDGWRVADILCTAGAGDRPFEERHPFVSMSLVLSGHFTYRAARGPVLLSQGSWLLVDAGRCFECSHEHGQGDRCLSFQLEPALLEEVVRDTGVRRLAFGLDRLPPLRELSAVAARAQLALHHHEAMEELIFELAGEILSAAHQAPRTAPDTMRHAHRIVASLQLLERQRAEPLALRELAHAAGLSPYHFLRSFKAVTGVTPHQWLVRARLRDAAQRLRTSTQRITDIALDVGFEDLSHFIRSFRRELGVSPRHYRTGTGGK